MKRKRRLYLVGQDPADIFEDLDKLKSDLANPKQARERAKETFARIPHDKALALFKLNLSGSAWAVLFELDRVILRRRGQNPVRFDCPRLAAAGLSGNSNAKSKRNSMNGQRYRGTNRPCWQKGNRLSRPTNSLPTKQSKIPICSSSSASRTNTPKAI